MGGCSSSQQAEVPNAYTQQNVFKVIVLDSRGQDGCTGQLEITFQELILNQRGKDSLHWPLWSLRRYGCDKDLFSFESGRRCPTGPGIYAFRCHQAESLFNLLQLSILWARQVQENRMSAISTLDPAAQATMLNRLHSTLQTGGSSDDASAVHNYVNGPASFQYYNVTQQQWQGVGAQTMQYADLDLPTDAENMEGIYPALAKEQTSKIMSSAASAHAYINVGGEHRSTYVNVPANGDKGKPYVNVPTSDKRRSVVVSESPLDSSTPGHRPQTRDWHRHSFRGFAFENSAYLCTPRDLAERQESKRGLPFVRDGKKYTDRVGDRRSLALPSSSRPFSLVSDAIVLEENRRGGYAAIDFDKTLAMKARSRGTDEGGLRKIRHSCDVETMYYC